MHSCVSPLYTVGKGYVCLKAFSLRGHDYKSKEVLDAATGDAALSDADCTAELNVHLKAKGGKVGGRILFFCSCPSRSSLLPPHFHSHHPDMANMHSCIRTYRVSQEHGYRAFSLVALVSSLLPTHSHSHLSITSHAFVCFTALHCR
jgi:hypothetical protein